MTRIEQSIEIDASPSRIWRVVSDLASVADWNPNVRSATCGRQPVGVGAERTCDLDPGGRVAETVSTWVHEQEMWFAIGPHGAIRSADMGFVIASTDDGATVTAVADYHLALGPVGPVIDALTTKRLMSRMLERSLEGLKAYAETRKAQP